MAWTIPGLPLVLKSSAVFWVIVLVEGGPLSQSHTGKLREVPLVGLKSFMKCVWGNHLYKKVPQRVAKLGEWNCFGSSWTCLTGSEPSIRMSGHTARDLMVNFEPTSFIFYEPLQHVWRYNWKSELVWVRGSVFDNKP